MLCMEMPEVELTYNMFCIEMVNRQLNTTRSLKGICCPSQGALEERG
jgi:hypothetical protein